MPATAPIPRRIGNPQSLYLITCVLVDRVDVFTYRPYRDAIIENLNFYHNQRGLCTYGYVVMPSFCLLMLRQAEGNLAFTIRDFKKMSGRMIADLATEEWEPRQDWLLHRFSWNAGNHPMGPRHQVWVHQSDAEEILTEAHYKERLEWLHHSPVRAGFVSRPEHWTYSSAFDLSAPQPKVKIFPWG